MNWLSIRFKLTAWYFAILAFGLALLGVGSWFGMRASLYEAVDDGLRDRIQGVQKFMREQISALSLREIRDEFREHSVLGPGGDLFQVCDSAGAWLYRSIPLENNQVPIRRPDQLGALVLYENARVQNTPVRLASQRIEVNGDRYTVQVAAPMEDFYASLERFRSTLLFGLPMLLLMATAGGYWLSRRAISPVDEITQTARSISINNLSGRLRVPRTGDELERLSETLNEMLGRLENSVRRITQFTADASHELRAPLALMRTTAELALRRQRPDADYRAALEQVLAEAEQTSELVDSLLLLARADSGTDALTLTPVNAVEAVREAVAQGERLGAEKGVCVQSAFPDTPLRVKADAQALRRLFLILIDNAVKYSHPGGAVRVTIRAEEGTLIGLVSDSGIGISEGDLPHIFDRFWRADKVRSRDLGGVGLGLSIGRWIAERHGGAISVQSKPGRGSIFCVHLPLIEKDAAAYGG